MVFDYNPHETVTGLVKVVVVSVRKGGRWFPAP